MRHPAGNPSQVGQEKGDLGRADNTTFESSALSRHLRPGSHGPRSSEPEFTWVEHGSGSLLDVGPPPTRSDTRGSDSPDAMTSHLVTRPLVQSGGQDIKERSGTRPPSTPPRLFFEPCTPSDLRPDQSPRPRCVFPSSTSTTAHGTNNGCSGSQPRRFSTTVPPPKPGPGTPPTEGSKNTALYVGAAAVGLGGLYYYYVVSDPRAQSDAERLKRKSGELGDAAKDSARSKIEQGQEKMDEYRVRALWPLLRHAIDIPAF